MGGGQSVKLVLLESWKDSSGWCGLVWCVVDGGQSGFEKAVLLES